MRILVLSQYWHPENGVPQRRWTWLSDLLRQSGHEVTVIAPPPHYHRNVSFAEWRENRKYLLRSDFEIGASGERIVRCSYLPNGNSLTGRALNQAVVSMSLVVTAIRRRGALRGYRPDLVIGTVPALPISWVTMLIAEVLRAPFVIDLRDSWPSLLYERDSWNEGTGHRSLRERVLSRGPIQLTSKIVESLMLTSYRRSSAMILTTQTLKSELQRDEKAGNLGSNKSLVTIRNVFPPESRITHLDDRADRGSGVLNVLYAGTMGRAQKLSNALDAVRIAREMGVVVNLRLVGTGATSAALRKQARAERLTVDFIGKVPPEGLDSHYCWADTALVHLTGWKALRTAVPSKTYELMSMEVHISAVASGETAELIRTLGAGNVVSPSDPIALAKLWVNLATNRKNLSVGKTASEWVRHEREKVVPSELAALIDSISSKNN